MASPAVIQGQTSQQNFFMFSLSKQINDAEMYWGRVAPGENFPISRIILHGTLQTAIHLQGNHH